VRRAAAGAGALTLALVAVCCAVAWPEDSPVAAQKGGATAGDTTWSWIFLGCLIGAFAAYAGGVYLIRRFGLGLVAVAILAAAIQLAPLGAPLLLSTDTWTYWDYGRIAAVHDANPYVRTPSDFPDDPAFPYVGEKWVDTTSVYGPAFTLASEPLALADGESADAAAWTYKALAALFLLGAAALAAYIARGRRAFALAFVAWNPLLAIHFAGGGHNDVWMAGLVLGALALGATGRRQWAGVSWVAAVLIKWIPLVFLPLRALEARANRREVGHLGFAAAAVVLVGVATWQFGWHWLGALGPLARNANEETRFAIPHRLEQLGFPDWLALAAVAAAFAIAYVWLLREAWRGRARLGLAAGLLLLATPYLVPWYAVWVVPLAAAEEDRAAQGLALVLCAYMLRQTIPL
jgi:glycosyl transferase family 87